MSCNNPSRRSFLSLTAAASAVAAFRVVTEPMLARAVAQQASPGAVHIDANENPLGPCTAAREAIAAIVPEGGRYLDELTDDLAAYFARSEGLNPDYVALYPGSSNPLNFTVLAFTSPARSYVTANPGFEAGAFAAAVSGARVVNVPLTRSYSHDVKSMLAAGSDAGVFYICTPNNPTGTLTGHSEIEYLVDNKPKDSIVLVDEAYIHFSGQPSCIDLAKAGRDVIVLRTFSKIYGMAGLRCGLAVGRPDLLEKIHGRGGWNAMPITAVAAAKASLQQKSLIEERRRINTDIRQATFDWLDKNGYSYVPSQTNFFMLDTRRPGKEVIDAMAQQNVMIGRIWPVWPTYVRITVGTQDEMLQFQQVFDRVMKVKTVGGSIPERAKPTTHLDGFRLRV